VASAPYPLSSKPMTARSPGAARQRPLVFDPSDVRAVLGEDLGYYLTYARHRVEEVSVAWGEHRGAGTSPDADLGFPRTRATVAPAPYDAHARTQYRRS
jgi:hypothetical protein